MKIITIHAKPSPKSKDYKEFSGAYVNFWIDYQDIKGAFLLAEYYLRSEKWILLKTQKKYAEFSSQRSLSTEEKQYFKEAKHYGYSIIFHTYPKKNKKRVT